MILVAVLVAADFHGLAARAQSASASSRRIDYNKEGIRFQIKALIPADAALSDGPRDDRIVSLYVKLRISAHSMKSNYFGEITKFFLDVRLSEGSDEVLFWQDGRCHQRRGLPKITVTAIDGFINNENGKIDVTARPRHLGKLLPSDEISPGRRLPGGKVGDGKYIAFRSRTKTSHLAVDVKVTITDCNLAGGATAAPR